MVSALFVLVVLAALGAALAKISQRQQLGSAAEIDAARAYQSARAGLEWEIGRASCRERVYSSV